MSASNWDLLLDDLALGQAVQSLPMDAQRRVSEIIGPRMPTLRKASIASWPDRPRVETPRPLLPPRRAAAPQRKASSRPEPDIEAVLRQTEAIMSRIPDPPARRRRPVTEPAEVMRALDALAARMPPAPRPGEPGADDARRRLGAALDGVLKRALVAQRAGAFTAEQVAAVEVRVNRLRQRVRLSRAADATQASAPIGDPVAGLEAKINATRRRAGLETQQ